MNKLQGIEPWVPMQRHEDLHLTLYMAILCSRLVVSCHIGMRGAGGKVRFLENTLVLMISLLCWEERSMTWSEGERMRFLWEENGILICSVSVRMRPLTKGNGVLACSKRMVEGGMGGKMRFVSGGYCRSLKASKIRSSVDLALLVCLIVDVGV